MLPNDRKFANLAQNYQRIMESQIQTRKALERQVAALEDQLATMLSENACELTMRSKNGTVSTMASETCQSPQISHLSTTSKQSSLQNSSAVFSQATCEKFSQTFQLGTYARGFSHDFGKSGGLCGPQTDVSTSVEKPSVSSSKNYNQMQQTQIPVQQLPNHIKQIVKELTSGRSAAPQQNFESVNSKRELEGLIEIMEHSLDYALQSHARYAEAVRRITVVSGGSVDAIPETPDQQLRQLFHQLTEECKAMRLRMFDLEVVNLSLEEENDQLKRDNAICHKLTETDKFKEMTLKNSLELKSRNRQLEEELSRLKLSVQKLENKNAVFETALDTQTVSASGKACKSEKRVEEMERQLAAAKQTINHLQTRIREFEKLAGNLNAHQAVHQKMTEVDSPVDFDGCTKRVFARTKQSCINHRNDHEHQILKTPPRETPKTIECAAPSEQVLEDSLQDKLNLLVELQQQKKECRHDCRMKSEPYIPSPSKQSIQSSNTKPMPLMRKGTLMPEKIY